MDGLIADQLHQLFPVTQVRHQQVIVGLEHLCSFRSQRLGASRPSRRTGEITGLLPDSGLSSGACFEWILRFRTSRRSD